MVYYKTDFQPFKLAKKAKSFTFTKLPGSSKNMFFKYGTLILWAARLGARMETFEIIPNWRS